MEEVEIEQEVESEWTCDSDEDKMLNEKDTKSKKSGGTSYKRGLQSLGKTSNGLQDSPELFRLNAKLRMGSNHKKFTVKVNELSVYGSQENLAKTSHNKRQKSMLIAHNEAESLENSGRDFVDPNSQAYATAVLGEKINKHQKTKIYDQKI